MAHELEGFPSQLDFKPLEKQHPKTLQQGLSAIRGCEYSDFSPRTEANLGWAVGKVRVNRGRAAAVS